MPNERNRKEKEAARRDAVLDKAHQKLTASNKATLARKKNPAITKNKDLGSGLSGKALREAKRATELFPEAAKRRRSKAKQRVSQSSRSRSSD